MGLEIRQIDPHVELESLQKDWDRILRTSGEDDVFLKLEWLRPCWETFGKGKSPVLLEVSEGDRVVAFAPLMISKKGKPIPLRWLEFIGSGPSDRCGVIAEAGRKDVHSALWKHVMRDRRWNVINLRDMKDEGPTTKNLKDSFVGGEYTYGTAPYLSLKGDHENYLKGLSRSTRQGMARYWRRLSADHDVRFVWDKEKSRAQTNLRTFVQLCTARWRGIGYNVLEMPGMINFLEKAVGELAQTGITVFTRLDADGRTVATQFGFEYNRSYLFYLSGFDPTFSDYSPGTLLMGKVIEECYMRGLEEVDMLRGGEDYKYRFKAVDRRQVHFRYVRPGIRGLIGKLETTSLR